MYIIYSVVPHFMDTKTFGPILPRETGYDTSEESARKRAIVDQGFYLIQGAK